MRKYFGGKMLMSEFHIYQERPVMHMLERKAFKLGALSLEGMESAPQ
jgi:hypothetical protein